MSDESQEVEKDIVLYDVVGESGEIAVITMNRPKYNNAQNGAMTYALDAAFKAAASDDAIKVIVLRGAGKHFSAGHDIGTPGRDIDQEQDRVSMWWDHTNKKGGEFLYVREQEAYLGMCRRWREIPKPTIAQVQGACIAGGLMLAWVCDLIVASDDATFSDPVVAFGVNGVEYFAHPWEVGVRKAKEMLFTGESISAEEARALGMVNHVVPREELESFTLDLAERIAQRPSMGLRLAKQSVNQAQDAQGFWTALQAAMSLQQLGHSHNAEVHGIPVDPQGAEVIRRQAKANR